MNTTHIHESYSAVPARSVPTDNRKVEFHCGCGAVRVRALPLAPYEPGRPEKYRGRAEWRTADGRIEEGYS